MVPAAARGRCSAGQTGAVRRSHHQGLTADMFVIRGGRFLVLTRATGRGLGIEYLPGGIVAPGEDPAETAVRETREECGLEVVDVSLLRVWTYPVPGEGTDRALDPAYHTVHATYVGHSEHGAVVLSHEHSAHRWVTPEEYVDQWCVRGASAEVVDGDSFFAQVRRNCELLAVHLARR